MSRLAVVAALGALLVLSGCSGGGDATAGPHDNSADNSAEGSADGGADEATGSALDPSAVLAFESPDADDFNLLLESEDDLLDLAAAQVLAVGDVGPQRLVVSFEMGAHHCFGARVSAAESGEQVVLDLQIGRRAAVAATLCPYGVYPYTIGVDLAEPLGQRSIVVVDGAEPAGTTDTSGDSTPAGDGATTDRPGQVVDSGDPTTVGPGSPEHLVGRHVEDGVEWALFHGRPWRILSNNGEAVDDGGPTDSDRISFVVVADVIVAHEWS